LDLLIGRHAQFQAAYQLAHFITEFRFAVADLFLLRHTPGAKCGGQRQQQDRQGQDNRHAPAQRADRFN
jgi:hypothetical protein